MTEKIDAKTPDTEFKIVDDSGTKPEAAPGTPATRTAPSRDTAMTEMAARAAGTVAMARRLIPELQKVDPSGAIAALFSNDFRAAELLDSQDQQMLGGIPGSANRSAVIQSYLGTAIDQEHRATVIAATQAGRPVQVGIVSPILARVLGSEKTK